MSTKLTLRLTAEESGPFAVATESLWFDKEHEGYRVKNIPFFVEGVSLNDIVSLESVGSSEFIIGAVVQKSGNSTIWLYVLEQQHSSELLQLLQTTSCRFETGVIEGLYAVSIPFDLNPEELISKINILVTQDKVIIDYPSWQH
jgi:hypothetical protein